MSAREDLFVAVLAREMRGCERVFLGANQLEAGLAAAMARRLWAPRLRYWAAGMAQIDPVGDAANVGRGTGENDLVAGRGASFQQARAFDDVLRAPTVFAGGLQVDARGNANLIGIPASGGWKLRGPGSAGLPSLTAFAERFYLISPRHEPRFLVESCAAISVLGDPVGRRAAGLRPDALVALLTPLARFQPSDEGLVLTELSPDTDLDEVRRATGFPVRSRGEVTTRPGLSTEESEAIAELRTAAER